MAVELMEDNKLLEEMVDIMDEVGDWSVLYEQEYVDVRKDVDRYHELADEAERRGLV